MAHYLFNLVGADAAAEAAECLRARSWAVDADEPRRNALAPGDLVLIYAGAPDRTFVGRAELASPVRDCPTRVLLAEAEQWDPPVPMSAVLARIDSTTARADFDRGVVEISAGEYEAAVAVARLSDSNRGAC